MSELICNAQLVNSVGLINDRVNVRISTLFDSFSVVLPDRSRILLFGIGFVAACICTERHATIKYLCKNV